MSDPIKEIKKVLKPFYRKGITRTPLDDYAIIVFPRSVTDPLTSQIREKVRKKYDNILSDNKIRKNFYVHFEMCTRKCSGCHYGTVTQGNKNEIVKAILDHIDLFPSHRYFLDKSAIRFGGGTPSLMSIEHVKSIYDKIVDKFNIKNVSGSTLEVHPEINRIIEDPENYIKQLKDVGITRVNLGMQECDDKILKKLRRGHTKNDVLRTYKFLKKHKFKTNIDLMWNLPYQTFESLEKSLRTAFGLKPGSVCTYYYWLRPGTRDYNLYKKGKLKLLDKPLEMKYLIKSIASEYGYKQRIIEWFFRDKNLDKYPSSIKQVKRKHAIDNMSLALIGFGPSTYSHLFSGFEENYMLWSPVPKNTRDSSANNIYRKMVDDGLIPHDRALVLGKEDTIRIFLMFKLRSGKLTKESLDYLIKESAGKEIETLVNNYVKYGLLAWNEKNQLVFTDAGDIIPNQIIASFTTDELLTKMIKRRDGKEDRYSWFPNPEKALKLKNIVKRNLV